MPIFSTTHIALAIIIVVIFTVYMAIVNIVFRTNKLEDRVKNTAPTDYLPENTEEHPPLLIRFCQSALALLKINPDAQKELVNWLSLAGIESPYAVTLYLFFSRIVQPLFLVLAVVLLFKLSKSGDTLDLLINVLVILCIAVAGLRGSRLYVENFRVKRMERLVYSFPEMLDLLLVCIESGLGLDAALNRVCKELRHIHPDIVFELDRLRLELTMLSDRSNALQNMADRIDLVSFKTLVAALIQTEKFGTSLTDTLRVLSEEQRLARLYNAEQRAARIPVLITIPLILCIMPAFIMIIIGPPIVKVINQGGLFGHSILVPKK